MKGSKTEITVPLVRLSLGLMPFEQDQRSLTDQIAALRKLAVQHGLYDADDWLGAAWAAKERR